MIEGSRIHAWSGSIEQLVATPSETILARLVDFVPDASPQQIRAWKGELNTLNKEGAKVIELHHPSKSNPTVLEYELPREGGRRPDVIVLMNGLVVVLEFKETGNPRHSDIDQVSAYARDLAGYHSACMDLDVVPLLVLCGRDSIERIVDGVKIIPADHLAKTLVTLAQSANGATPDLSGFLNGEYAPLPTLVAAARLLFNNLGLPFIKRAHSAGVNGAVEMILEKSREIRSKKNLCLVLLTGVPGAGKTLVGLQVTHAAALEEGFRFGRRRERGAPSTFLSGNGPLVQVLQNALKSTAFVQDMHRFVKEYGLVQPDRIPFERLIVFDEAQRAWDREKIIDFYQKKLPALDPSRYESEPRLLTQIASRMEEGALVLALVGQGQEIHTGEEAGIGQWADAIANSERDWTVIGPPSLELLFADKNVLFQSNSLLNLDVGLRYHSASNLHLWVEHLLDRHDFEAARKLAKELRKDSFPIYVTRDIEAARSYLRTRFSVEPLRRYGQLASSKSAGHLLEYDLYTGFQDTKRISIGEWFNAEPSAPRSCCQLKDTITEFQCQGLELDMALVCWSDDFWWQNDAWAIKNTRANPLVRNPHQLRTNAYRVLLTRGREGLVIFVPPKPAAKMDATFRALVDAGAMAVSAVEKRLTA